MSDYQTQGLDIEEELFDIENDELDLSYQNVDITRNIYEYIKEMCKDTNLFSELVEEDLYEYLYPEEKNNI